MDIIDNNIRKREEEMNDKDLLRTHKVIKRTMYVDVVIVHQIVKRTPPYHC